MSASTLPAALASVPGGRAPASAPSGPIAYRADIDGLRALAVGVVVGFHAFPSLVRGGFIGVDVFFVISGYLITSIIRADLARGAFSLADFYGRRIRRIFPALLLVLAACLAAGWGLLLADEYEALGRHVAAGAGFASNLVLLSESGYFDTVSEKKILLHLWSLAIEEQFYLVWPILMLALARLRALRIGTGLLVLAAFALSVLEVRADRVLAFYSPLARSWELLLGALLALVEFDRPAAIQRLRERHGPLLSGLGFALLALGLGFTRRSIAFPGWWALMPTLGAALIIAAGPQAGLNRRLLASRAAVWIGRISYPLYLWHWPLLAFAAVLAAGVPSVAVRVAAVALAFVAAWLTFRLVERRVRAARGIRLAPWLAVAMVVTGAAGLALMHADGAPDRSVARSPAVHQGDIGHAQFLAALRALPNFCQQYDAAPYQCFQSAQGMVKPKLAVFGDSHAEHLGLGLAEQLPGMNVVVFSAMGLPSVDSPGNRRLIEAITGDARIGVVIVAAAWHSRLTSRTSREAFAPDLMRLVGRLAAPGRAVHLADDVPQFLFSPEQCKYRLPGRPFGCTQEAAHGEAQRRVYLPALEQVARARGVGLVRVSDLFCQGGSCSMLLDGALAYRDTNHLGIQGSRAVARRLIGQIPALGAQRAGGPTAGD